MSENSMNSTEEIVLSVEMSDSISAQAAEAWAVGQRGGVDVAETDPTWHNNAKYYAEQCAGAEQAAQDAEDAAEQAESAKTAAEAARDLAKAIGAGAAQSATAAAESAQAAATAKSGAETAQSAAAGSATAAEGAAGRASQSATAAGQSATDAGTAKTAAEAARDAAAGSAAAAGQSAQAAATSAQAAEDVAESIPEDYSQLSADVTGLKSAIGEKQIIISTTESSPYAGYWAQNSTTGKMNLNATTEDGSRTLEHPIDISSLNPGVKVSLLASIMSSFGAFITDESFNSLDYVNASNAEEKGYTVTSTPQIVTLEVPKGAKYIMADIRSAYYTGLSDFDVTVYDNSVTELLNRMDEAESVINIIDDKVNTIRSEIGGGEITITPQLSERKNGYYARQSSSNRMVYAESSTYFTVEPIDISKLIAGTQVKMQASVNNAYGIFITDSGLNVLDYVNGSNAEAKGYSQTSRPQLVTLTVPSNAKYITSDIRTSYFTDMSIFAVAGTQKDNITLMQEEVSGLSVDGNVLSGKKWVACGDSFTAGSFGYSLTDNYIFEDGLYAGNNKVYPYWIGRRNPFMEVVNEAISGSTMTGGESGVNPFSGTRYTSIPDDADYITLMFGINDSGNACQIGTIDDSDNTTFYGAWNVVLGYFMEHFPFAHIGIIIGPGMQTSSGQNYANAEIEIAKKWGIPYLNIQFESGGGKIPLMLRTNNPDVSQAVKSACNERQFVNPSTETPNYHPNEDAHEFESTFIEAWLRTL